MTVTDIARQVLEDRVSDSTVQTPRYSIEVESYSDSYAVLRVSGDLDMSSRTALTHNLGQLTASGADVLIDLSAVSFMYSGAVNAVITSALASDGSVRVFAPTRPARMVIESLGAAALLVDHRPSSLLPR
ncbi:MULTISPECIES: STAS domain-containing protein [unclassified Rhodococcus (in: high G+C Gram-positive bacteria)]|uniref:STAS domain-containing protein n=1 Tax=unclassified Rhodococcus (in: high G+C Gram-positive bacteria) TaxID=192944 RepID=UPI0015C47892|nr:STAS domain-containing protein [Rhodococcus sp. 1163]